MTRNFVSEGEWKRGARGYTVESEADIGMADAAAGNLYYHLASPRLKSEEFVSLQTVEQEQSDDSRNRLGWTTNRKSPSPRSPLTATLGE